MVPVRIFWGKGKEIEKRLGEYIREMNNCMKLFYDFCFAYLEKGCDEALREVNVAVRDAESRCDDIRHDIEHQLFQGALIPSYRGDIYSLLEAVDKVPNKAESTSDNISLQNVCVPDELKDDFRELLRRTTDCTLALSESLNCLFTNIRDAANLSKKVDELESAVDEHERMMIKKVFDMDVELALKMLLKELIIDVASIADRAENAANVLEMIAVKGKA
ncbi:MAG: DUF47 family protein [bacterium]